MVFTLQDLPDCGSIAIGSRPMRSDVGDGVARYFASNWESA
jgi:hypothetical protein